MENKPLMYESIREELLLAFPELNSKIQSVFGSYYDLSSEMPDPYPIFEDVVKKLLMQLLRSGQDDNLLSRLFGFFERMAHSQDGEVQNLLGIAILGPLIYDSESSRRAWQYMGDKITELARSEAEIQNEPESLPPR